MVRFFAVLLASTAAAAEPVDIGRLVNSWPAAFVMTGTKTEPTYIYHVRVTRSGDRFDLAGGAPLNVEPAHETVTIGDGQAPIGFLATASIVAAVRAGRLTGGFEPVTFGERSVVCIPAETIGVARPIVDPCVDLETGAVLAQRHRLTGDFDGPSLDPWSVAIKTN